MGAHARTSHPGPRPPAVPPRDHRLPFPASALNAVPGRGTERLLEVLTPVHSERLDALNGVLRCFSDVRDFAGVLAGADGYPVLAVSQVSGYGGTLTLGCAYHRDLGCWWIVTLGTKGRVAWIAAAREPRRVVRLVVADMRKRNTHEHA